MASVRLLEAATRAARPSSQLLSLLPPGLRPLPPRLPPLLLLPALYPLPPLPGALPADLCPDGPLGIILPIASELLPGLPLPVAWAHRVAALFFLLLLLLQVCLSDAGALAQSLLL
jgi:hypothetical protein